MTINKAHGESLKVAWLKLNNDVFSHGHLCVSYSRVGKPESLFTLATETGTAVTHKIAESTGAPEPHSDFQR